MTLTMTLAANGLLVQSADHRLMRVPDGSLYDDAEPKHLFVQSLGGQASVVSFTEYEVRLRARVGSVVPGGKRTAGQSRASLEDIAEAVCVPVAKDWLQGIVGDRRHTFTMAGFNVKEAEVETRIALISNWQRMREIDRCAK